MYDRNQKSYPRGDYKPQDRAPVITSPTPCTVTANLFKFNGKKIVLHHYLVTFSHEILSKNIFKKFMLMAEKNNFVEPFAFDGNNMLVSHKKFQNTQLTLPMRDGELVCKIEYKNSYDMADQNVDPSMMVQCMEVVVRFYQKQLMFVEKKKMIDPSSKSFHLAPGLEIIPGLTSNFKINRDGFYMNLDMVFTVFHKRMTLVDLVAELSDRENSRHENSRRESGRFDPNRPLTNDFCSDLERFLKGVQITTNHRERNSTFKLSGILNMPASSVEFEVDGSKITIAEYFAKTYKPLKYPNLPLVVIKKKENTLHIPFEVCEVSNFQKYSKKLNDVMTAQMIRVAAKKPNERFEMIKEKVKELKALDNENLKRFGMCFDTNMLNTTGLTLPPPSILFKNESQVQVSNGSFNLKGVKALQGASVVNWSIFCFRGSVQQSAIQTFVSLSSAYGVEFSSNPKIVNVKDVTDFFNSEKSKFNLVILPDKNAQRYEEIKRIAETYSDVITQCMVSQNIEKLTNPSFVSNLLIKINTKLGGKNWSLKESMLSDKPTLIVGIDVNHPGVGDLESPSIVAVVGTIDYKFINYKTYISQQDRREEICGNLKDTIKNLLRVHYANTKTKPERIIVFRDGVGDSMFNCVFNVEIDAIKKACSEIDPKYSPQINFIAAQKRHSVRFMSEGKNLIPGTVVDKINHQESYANVPIHESTVCNDDVKKVKVGDSKVYVDDKKKIDFYLVSQNALQGTARPVRYLVLLNESNFTEQQVHSLTYNLCHLYSAATKSVSVVTPIYYAHLAAERGKCYLERNNNGVVVMRQCNPEVNKTLYYI